MGYSIPIARNILVLLYCFGLLVLGIRSLLTQDMRFGWGMFGSSTEYKLSYAWIDEEGQHIPATDDSGLRGKTYSFLHDDTAHAASYGIGAIRIWVQGYAEYMAAHPIDKNYKSFTAKLEYVVNRQGTLHIETFTQPVTQ